MHGALLQDVNDALHLGAAKVKASVKLYTMDYLFNRSSAGNGCVGVKRLCQYISRFQCTAYRHTLPLLLQGWKVLPVYLPVCQEQRVVSLLAATTLFVVVDHADHVTRAMHVTRVMHVTRAVHVTSNHQIRCPAMQF